MTEVPECVAHVPELYCQRKSGLRSLEKFEDVFRTSKERVDAGERGARRPLRDLLRQGPGRGLAAPAVLPHLHRLADRIGAGQVRLRAGRRHPGRLRPRPQGRHRRPRQGRRGDGDGGDAAARRGVGRDVSAPPGRGWLQNPESSDPGVGDQAGGDHQHHRGDEDQGDDQLDLRRGAGGPLFDRAAAVAAQGARLAAELIGERRAEAARALDRGDQRRQLAAGDAGAEGGERGARASCRRRARRPRSASPRPAVPPPPAPAGRARRPGRGRRRR